MGRGKLHNPSLQGIDKRTQAHPQVRALRFYNNLKLAVQFIKIWQTRKLTRTDSVAVVLPRYPMPATYFRLLCIRPANGCAAAR
jgi:hypothetical protein